MMPQLKKKLGAFLLGEEGKISKQALMKVGALLSAAALTSTSARSAHSQHFDGAALTYQTDIATGTHSDNTVYTPDPHANHSNHGSHGSASW